MVWPWDVLAAEQHYKATTSAYCHNPAFIIQSHQSISPNYPRVKQLILNLGHHLHIYQLEAVPESDCPGSPGSTSFPGSPGYLGYPG